MELYKQKEKQMDYYYMDMENNYMDNLESLEQPKFKATHWYNAD